ncbi:unnamed protein product [Effrenium voratum]|uniref:SnoaL-like domain-containing protein n=1 Tax=Effrenium voratum TaxID=2562239 RepID=A0AA36N3R6_9DINO|nr:unnamed protein product [Effrenium voratum]
MTLQVGRCTFLLLAAWATCEAERMIDDETVLAQQQIFMTQWRKKFNKGDVEYCGKAYRPDASFHASFGPLADKVKKLVYLPDPAQLHGQDQIKTFWNASRIALGFEEMEAYESEGEYAASAMVVDDDTVVVSSPVAFKTKCCKVKGRMLSETWIRTGPEWKLSSVMMALESMQQEKVDQAEKNLRAPATSETVTELPATTESTTPAANLNNTIVAASDGSSTAKAAEGQSTFLAGITVLAVASVAAVMVRRARNRRAAAISGFESMLG